jgi:hypothetical protein
MQEFISFLAHDPKYKELSQEFTTAHNALKSYLGERVDLLIDYEQKEREFTAYAKSQAKRKMSDIMDVV